MKKIVSICVILLTIFMVGGCETQVDTKEYSINGFTITLPENFYEKDLVSTTVYLESEEAIVTALKENFTDLAIVELDENSTLEDYGNIVITNNQLDKTLSTSENGEYVYFTYENDVSGKTMYYMAAIFKADDAFWLINFACDITNKDIYSDTFMKWANSIEV